MILCKDIYNINMAMKRIENLRDQINKLDDQVLSLLDKRSEIVLEIGKAKDKSKGIIDENREQEVINRLINLSKGKYSKDSIIRIWRELFQASSKLQIDNTPIINSKRSIEKIEIYVGGKSSIKGSKEITKLSSNENPFGPSEKLLNFSSKEINRYPEINGKSLRNEIAKLNKLKSEQIVLGCGSDETLLFAALSFCQSGDEIIHSEHGFEMYSIIAKIVGAVSKLAKEYNYKLSVKSICNELTPATKLIYIANPNNPTGSYLTKNQIREIMNKIPKSVIMVLDGAYAEYVDQHDYDSDFSLVEEFENIILTRTFSKAYGLAGIRLGWCYSSERVSSILNKVKGPFNTSSVAQKMAIIALNDQEHLKKIILKNKINKVWFETELKKLNFKVIKTHANFSFIESSVKRQI